jgi:hypothetical protein
MPKERKHRVSGSFYYKKRIAELEEDFEHAYDVVEAINDVIHLSYDFSNDEG